LCSPVAVALAAVTVVTALVALVDIVHLYLVNHQVVELLLNPH
jgi:hypothetical protein